MKMASNNTRADSFVCFVTDELFPITYGGCGTLLSNSICELLAIGNNVLVLADIPEAKLQSFRELAPIPQDYQDRLVLISVPTALEKTPNVGARPDRSTPLRQSWRYWKALDWCLQNFNIRFVEFPDYKGWGYFALTDGKHRSCPKRPTIAVRYHLPMEQIDATAPSELLGLNRFLQFQLERRCFDASDKLLFPSDAMARLASAFYQNEIAADQVVVSPPSFAAWGLEPRHEIEPNEKRAILFYSRLAPQKGAENFISAALRLLADGKAKDLRFVVAGPDMMQSPVGGSMSDYLVSLVPKWHQSRFEFTGNLDREALTKMLPSVLFAVFPTHSETYCYAAREIMMAGVPTIVSDLPAFEDLKEQDAAKTVDVTTEALFQGMAEFIEKPSKRESYETPWLPPPALGQVYQEATNSSEPKIGPEFGLTVLILAETLDGMNSNSPAIIAARRASGRILAAIPSKTGQSRIMGRLCKVYDFATNTEVSDPEVESALCLLMLGDDVPEEYLVQSVKILRQDSRLNCVGGDTMNAADPNPIWDRVPWDAIPELLPFERSSLLSRCVLRGDKTNLSQRLLPQLSDLQEIHAIWQVRSDGGGLTRMFDQTISIDGVGEKTWRKAVDPRASAIGLRMLIDLFEFDGGHLRVGKMLQCLANYEMQQIRKTSIDRNVIIAVKKGYIPEIHGIRLNLSNIIKLLLSRVTYLFSIRPKSLVGTGQVLKAIARKLGLR